MIEQLNKAGWLDDEGKQMGYAIIQAYTRSGDDPNERVADVSFGPDGVTVNGLPVQ